MAIIITKKTKTILIIVLGVLVLFTSGFLIWRVTQEETVAPDDIEAQHIYWREVPVRTIPTQCRCPGDNCTVVSSESECNAYRCGTKCFTGGYGDECCAYYSCSRLAPYTEDVTANILDYDRCPDDFVAQGYTSTCPSGNCKEILFARRNRTLTWRCHWPPRNATFSCFKDLTKPCVCEDCPDGYTTEAICTPGEQGCATMQVTCTGDCPDNHRPPICYRYTPPIPNPQCGSYSKQYPPGATGWGSGGFCNPGTPNPSRTTLEGQFPRLGSNTTWECVSGSKEVSCEATRADWDDPLCGSLNTMEFQSTVSNWPTGETFCDKGTPQPAADSINFPSLGGTTDWKCVEGTKEVTCSVSRLDSEDPICGSLHDQTFGYNETSWPMGTFCDLGDADPSDPSFPQSGGSTSWQCINEDKSVSCSAYRSSMAVSNGGTVPQTNIFSTVLGRISFGFSFILLGGLVSQYSRINYFFTSVGDKYRFRREVKKKQRREMRVNRSRDKLEDRFK